MTSVIYEINDEAHIIQSAELIRISFETVARDLKLTKDNCPSHTSFITEKQLFESHDKGLWFFGLFVNNNQSGFVAVEKGNTTTYYMEKLAVLPAVRHQGYGEKLVHFVADFAARQGALKLSIGTIHEHVILKEWYKKLGFTETGLKKFAHLPFTVCFMEKDLRVSKKTL
jgi:ribosomal protein S18 acetylase RimI-like enzyme